MLPDNCVINFESWKTFSTVGGGGGSGLSPGSSRKNAGAEWISWSKSFGAGCFSSPSRWTLIFSGLTGTLFPELFFWSFFVAFYYV
jgi:hypothetical protein